LLAMIIKPFLNSNFNNFSADFDLHFELLHGW
jgi:hypothetical protein